MKSPSIRYTAWCPLQSALSRSQEWTGVSRLAAACPEARIILCAVSGTTDFVRFPKRPRVRVEFIATAALPSPSEAPQDYASALLLELRRCVPPVQAGRR